MTNEELEILRQILGELTQILAELKEINDSIVVLS